ncbi:MAG: rpsB [Haloplasmataceae bacterium]|jgi:small subunit ribosomal protein S2|nr:rpsB [Haloplasmataceae bacterium]
MNLKVLNILYELGVHIGEVKQKIYPINNFFILGFRNNLHIINLEITLFFLKKASLFLKSVGNKNSHLFFYYSNLHSLNRKIVGFFIYHIYKNNHSFVFNNWRHGLLSNFNVQALEILSDLFPEKKKKNYNFNFTSLLFRLIFFTFQTKETGTDWFKHLKLIKKYWRFFSFYLFFKNLNIVPDVAIIINANKMISPVKECNSLRIPVIGPVDTDTNIRNFTYPIPSNDNSFLISAFYFLLFMNSYKKGYLSNYYYNF